MIDQDEYPRHTVKKNPTLVEIIVVVAVISILLALLFPVFGHSGHHVSYTSICMTNLQQQAGAVRMYSQDFDEVMPDGKRWTDELTPYTKSQAVFFCPQAANMPRHSVLSDGYRLKEGAGQKEVSEPFSEYLTAVYGYAYHSRLSGKLIGSVREPAETVLTYDAMIIRHRPASQTKEPIPATEAILRNISDEFTSVPTTGPHFGGDCISFVDGHAAWKNQDDILELRKVQASRGLPAF